MATKIKDLPLPGKAAHDEMAPSIRRKLIDVSKLVSADPRRASVLALLYPIDGVPHFPLILRHTYEGVHSGQVGFPGGKWEPEDPGPEAAALREAEEELGI